MRRLQRTVLIVSGLLGVLVPAGCADQGADKIRVACLGDSITYGTGIERRRANCYPARLGRLLGRGYMVRNFGVAGSTLLRKGDNPYVEQQAYEDAKDWKPHIIIIELGTNDTKPWNWEHEAEFVTDCKAMIEELSQLETKPRIWLCAPVPAYPGDWGIDEERIKTGVKPKIEQAAKESRLPVIDLHAALSDKPNLFPDTVHPNAEGAALIAKTVHHALTSEAVKK